MARATREWVTFQDPKEEARTWQIDVTFLLSSWQCIYGCGCPGIAEKAAPELEIGCCSHGAYFSDRKDRDHVVKVAKQLDDSEWELAKVGRRKGIFQNVGKDEDGKSEFRTRVVDGACVFLNRAGFPNGAGCALHQHAMRTGVHHSTVKPEVCWQLPLRRVDEEQTDGSVISTLSEYSRSGWGEGGEDFGWWCTEEPAAFSGAEPVYRSLAEELRRMLGKKLYANVEAYLADRERNVAGTVVRHPAEVPVVFVRRDHVD